MDEKQFKIISQKLTLIISMLENSESKPAEEYPKNLPGEITAENVEELYAN